MCEEKSKQLCDEDVTEVKSRAWGVRHVQAACMFVCLTALLVVRSSMGVAVLAMTDARRNSSLTTYDWDKKTQGVILSSFFWGYVAMQIPAGVLSNKFGGKPILLVALLANGLICLLIPLLASVGGWQLVCAARVATGLTQACTLPACHTLLGRWLPDHERVLISTIVYGGTQLGTILGMLVSGILAGTALGWPMVFYAMAALMMCTAALWHWLAASAPAHHRCMTAEEQLYIEKGLNTAKKEQKLRTPWRYILTSRAVWGLVIAHVGASYTFVLFFVDMPTYLEKGLHISLKNSAALSALPYIGMWIGNTVSGIICEKVYNKGWLSAGGCRKVFNSIGAVGVTASLIGLTFIREDDSTLAVIWLVSALTFCGFFVAGFMMNHLDMSPNFAGLLLSITNFIANIGSILTPILTSFTLNNDPTDLSRWRYVFIIAAVISLATNLAYVLTSHSQRQPWDDPGFLDKRAADSEEMKPVMNDEKKEKSDDLVTS